MCRQTKSKHSSNYGAWLAKKMKTKYERLYVMRAEVSFFGR